MDVEKAKDRLDKCIEQIKSPDENQQMYTEWSKTYDKDKELLQFRTPNVVGQLVADLYTVRREKISILDVAAGTGLVGDELFAHGFKIIDALDANESMLQCASNRHVHRKQFVETVPENGSTSISSDSYDVVTSVSGFGKGGLPVNAITEMIRLVKPDGYIVLGIREYNFHDVAEYKDSLKPLMLAMEESGKWTKIREIHLERALLSSTGFVKHIVFAYKKNN